MVCIYITISLPSIHIYSFKKKVLLKDDIKRYAKHFCKTSKNKSKNLENLTYMSKVHISIAIVTKRLVVRRLLSKTGLLKEGQIDPSFKVQIF